MAAGSGNRIFYDRSKAALFLQAARELNINLGLFHVVGNVQMDIDAGRALGCKTILVTSGLKETIFSPLSIAPPSAFWKWPNGY